MRSSNVKWQEGFIGQKEREALLKQKGVCLWFTGLSGSGKSTVASAVEKKIYEMGYLSYILDGDNIRHGLNGDLGFSDEDRKENIRRIGELSKLFTDAGLITLTAFISPFRADRERVRNILEKGKFIEVFVDCPLEVCENRDVKGLYAKARNNEIKAFTGITSPYEAPEKPEIIINTAEETIEGSAEIIINYLINHNIIEKK
ncbi:MAG: adenylyl-sulfate kinase [Candidatus Neomarinimicrobiota bacterium]|jgi:adenylylsulfate kinase